MNLWQRAVLHALTLVVAVCTAALGQWQLGRAHEKEALHARQEAQGALSLLRADELLAIKRTHDVFDRRVRLRGKWLSDQTVYLENRSMRGQVGFYVLTPMRLEGRSAVVLIQRGWIPRSAQDRSVLAPVDTPSGVVDLDGRIAPPPAKLLELGGPSAGPIRHNVDLASLETEWGIPLAPVLVIQEGPTSEGLLRDWPQVVHTAAKNYGYAFQWWALCALTVFLNVWFQFIAPRRRRAG